jgi:hypothetical protein
MKKVITSFILFMLIVLPIFNISTLANTDEITVLINNEILNLTQPAIMKNNTTMVPFRDIFEALGAQVFWEPSTQMILAIKAKDQTVISLQIGKNRATVNGKIVELSEPPQLNNGTTLVPLRFVSEALGASVEWNGKSKTITITDQNIMSTIQKGNSTEPIITIFFEGDHPIEFLEDPVIENGILLAQVDPIFKRIRTGSMSKSMNVTRTSVSGKIGDEFSFIFEADKNTALINGKEKALPIAPKIIGNQLLVPIEFLMTELDLFFSWDEKERTAYIFSPNLELILNDIQSADLEKMRYVGDFKDGKMHGEGKLYMDDHLWYEGDFDLGEISGYGTFYFRGTPIYTGDVIRRVAEGKGMFYRLDGNKFFGGDLVNGVLHGNGVSYYDKSYGENVVQYEGSYENGLRNGHGKLYYNSNNLWYEGDWKDGQFHGKGKSYSDGIVVYDGHWDNHIMTGFGKEYYSDGLLKYDGYFDNDLYHGQGTLYFKSGFKFVGELVYGDFGQGVFYQNVDGHYIVLEQIENGVGTKVYNNGDYYVGNIKNGKANGSGKYYDSDSHLVYDGEFLEDKYHGKGSYFIDELDVMEGQFIKGEISQGKYYVDDRLIYEGQFENSNFHGHGKLYIYDRLFYEGEFIEGSRSGFGKEFNIEGSLLYEGTVEFGTRQGIGTLYYPNGTILYEGEFDNNYFDGQGKFYNKQGQLLYSGEFKSNIKDGKGILYFGNGDQFRGSFYLGSIRAGTYYDAHEKEIAVKVISDGFGRVYTDDGSLYIGEMMNGDPHGRGTYYESDGNKYVGDFANGTVEGDGSYYHSNGQLFYKGQFKDSMFHGHGVLYDNKGREFSKGEFNKGVLIIDETVSTQKNEFTTIESIQTNLTKIVVDEFDGNQLQSDEAFMILQLTTEEDYNQFMQLSQQGKMKLINGYVQENWEVVLGVKYYYVHIKYKGEQILETYLKHQMSDEQMFIYYLTN